MRKCARHVTFTVNISFSNVVFIHLPDERNYTWQLMFDIFSDKTYCSRKVSGLYSLPLS